MELEIDCHKNEEIMEYKKAEMVELHNSNVIIHLDRYSDGIIGWTESPGDNEEFYVEGDRLSTLLQMIGVDVEPVQEERQNVHMKHIDFPIKRRKVVVGSDDFHKIVGLEVKIDGPHLLHLRFVTQWEDDGKKINATQELTYTGSFTVWWPYDAQKETETAI
jgi:hypothetical protein